MSGTEGDSTVRFGWLAAGALPSRAATRASGRSSSQRQFLTDELESERFEMIGFIVGMIVIGLIAGFIARALVPGRDSMSVAATIVLGVVGSFIGGLLADVFVRNDAQDKGVHPVGLIGSVIGAVVALLVYRAMNRNRVHQRH